MSNKDFAFHRIDWQHTLRLNLLRAVFAGAVIMMIMTFSGELPFSQAMVYLVGAPFIYIIGALPFGLLFQALLSMPFIKVLFPIWAAILFMRFAFGLFVTLGDPFVYFLHNAKPQWVPIPENFKILNFALVIFLLHPAVPVSEG